MNSQLLLVLAAAALLAITLIHPLYPQEQWLQHPPTALCLIALAVAARKRWFTTAAIGCLVAMLVLHIVGARWIYSNVPYEKWCDALFGAGPQEWFGWTRNHYDRLVHLAFGLLMPKPIAEAATRYGGLSRRWAVFTALSAVAAASAVYEVFEWLLAMVAAPEYAENYNGQQGDLWDGQKDMALAIAGNLIAAIPLALRRGMNGLRRKNNLAARDQCQVRCRFCRRGVDGIDCARTGPVGPSARESYQPRVAKCASRRNGRTNCLE